jgi:hypothetical protein
MENGLIAIPRNLAEETDKKTGSVRTVFSNRGQTT